MPISALILIADFGFCAMRFWNIRVYVHILRSRSHSTCASDVSRPSLALAAPLLLLLVLLLPLQAVLVLPLPPFGRAAPLPECPCFGWCNDERSALRTSLLWRFLPSATEGEIAGGERSATIGEGDGRRGGGCGIGSAQAGEGLDVVDWREWLLSRCWIVEDGRLPRAPKGSEED